MARNQALSFMGILSVVFFCSCSKDPTSPNQSSPESISYTVTLPPGKLPWPHHRPDMSEQEYERLLNELFIINNFGQYQGDNTKESLYFHDGLDIVIPNGSPAYAIESGYVRAIFGTAPYYQTLVIEDRDMPGYGWSYTHIAEFNVKVGDQVTQGRLLAQISFQGVPHTHLSRVFLTQGGRWDNFSDLNSLQPDTFFVFNDTSKPVIEEGFNFVRNNSDSVFRAGNPTIVSGEVDIVVGIRERGEYAHSKGGVVYQGFGDRLCVNRIEYEISGNGISPLHRNSFDFSKIILTNKYGFRDYSRISTVYMFYHTIHPEGVTSWDKIFSYYVITNTDGTNQLLEIDPSHQDFSWRTNEKDTSGNLRFANGDYWVTVRAYDSKGNVAVARENVRVTN